MGLFGKLFDKKECAFCGGEIGLLGNRKLEDGNMCKNCAGKLSPWFDDRRHSTIAQIQEQLDYREANKEKVDAFRVTRTLGENTKVLLDENAGVFMVTSARNYRDTNPDVIKFSDVTGCNVDIDETRDEDEYRNSEGELVSYDPPRYRYYYNFFITIHVNNPYFDEIRFMLNSSRVEVREQMPQPRQGDIMGTIFNALGSMANTSTLNAEYETYYRMAQEIREALLQVRQTARDEAVAAAAPQGGRHLPVVRRHHHAQRQRVLRILRRSVKLATANRLARPGPAMRPGRASSVNGGPRWRTRRPTTSVPHARDRCTSKRARAGSNASSALRSSASRR